MITISYKGNFLTAYFDPRFKAGVKIHGCDRLYKTIDGAKRAIRLKLTK